jgi:hypothetical protein
MPAWASIFSECHKEGKTTDLNFALGCTDGRNSPKVHLLRKPPVVQTSVYMGKAKSIRIRYLALVTLSLWFALPRLPNSCPFPYSYQRTS